MGKAVFYNLNNCFFRGMICFSYQVVYTLFIGDRKRIIKVAENLCSPGFYSINENGFEHIQRYGLSKIFTFSFTGLELSVIIVNYNVKHFLEQCLYSVRKSLAGIQGEIFVIDNNSADNSVE